jgi:hypothetical protein
VILIVLLICVFLAVGAAFHYFWAFGGRAGWHVAVPQHLDGTQLFAPSRTATFAVAAMLTIVLIVLVVYALRLDLLPRNWLRTAMVLFGLAFLIRGLAWHRYVGLFKTVRTTAFGRNDTRYYSPGCVLAGIGFLLLAWEE